MNINLARFSDPRHLQRVIDSVISSTEEQAHLCRSALGRALLAERFAGQRSDTTDIRTKLETAEGELTEWRAVKAALTTFCADYEDAARARQDGVKSQIQAERKAAYDEALKAFLADFPKLEKQGWEVLTASVDNLIGLAQKARSMAALRLVLKSHARYKTIAGRA